ncbi:MAG: amidohydrolase family protein [Candidatus Bathyarchaeia archaeon]
MVSYDVLIANGRVVDGCGHPWFKADIGISEGKTREIGKLAKRDAEKAIDADNLIVCPGFIDIHTHSDFQLLVNPTMDSHVHQGITTDVIGNCGISVSPVSEFYKERAQPLLRLFDMTWTWKDLAEFRTILKKKGISLNVATLIGHSAVRAAVMGTKKAAPTPKELDRMKELVAEDMKQGSFGMSTGLFYAPGGYASTSEIIELAKTVAEHGGIYATHMRSEGDIMIESLKEALEIGEKANMPIQISHYKSTGPQNWGKIKVGFKMMEQARKKGLDVTCDAYPWTAGVTPLIDYLPHWAQEGGTVEILRRLEDPILRKKIRTDMEKGIPGEESLAKELGWERIMISACPSDREYEGKTVEEITQTENKDPYDLIFGLLMQNKTEVIAIEFWGSEKDVEKVLKHPLTMISSDSAAITPNGPLGLSKCHPRYYGNIPKLLNDYVKKRKIMTLEDAVRKATSFPAQKLGLNDRGQISKGKWADIVVFDPDEIAPVGTFGDPHHFPKGVKWVLVNGVVTIEKGNHTGALAGKVLTRH